MITLDDLEKVNQFNKERIELKEMLDALHNMTNSVVDLCISGNEPYLSYPLNGGCIGALRSELNRQIDHLEEALIRMGITVHALPSKPELDEEIKKTCIYCEQGVCKHTSTHKSIYHVLCVSKCHNYQSRALMTEV